MAHSCVREDLHCILEKHPEPGWALEEVSQRSVTTPAPLEFKCSQEHGVTLEVSCVGPEVRF